jgi:hypothetical protein
MHRETNKDLPRSRLAVDVAELLPRWVRAGVTAGAALFGPD